MSMTNCERAKKNVDNLEIQTRLIVENLRQCGKEFEASERRRLILENAVIELRANLAEANAQLKQAPHGTVIPCMESLGEENKKLREALKPLAAIAEAYHANCLDECRPEWGDGEEHDRKVELFTGRGGNQLLTLQHALQAAKVLKGVLT